MKGVEHKIITKSKKEYMAYYGFSLPKGKYYFALQEDIAKATWDKRERKWIYWDRDFFTFSDFDIIKYNNDNSAITIELDESPDRLKQLILKEMI